jgi:hypothetical protein
MGGCYLSSRDACLMTQCTFDSCWCIMNLFLLINSLVVTDFTSNFFCLIQPRLYTQISDILKLWGDDLFSRDLAVDKLLSILPIFTK